MMDHPVQRSVARGDSYTSPATKATAQFAGDSSFHFVPFGMTGVCCATDFRPNKIRFKEFFLLNFSIRGLKNKEADLLLRHPPCFVYFLTNVVNLRKSCFKTKECSWLTRKSCGANNVVVMNNPDQK